MTTIYEILAARITAANFMTCDVCDGVWNDGGLIEDGPSRKAEDASVAHLSSQAEQAARLGTGGGQLGLQLQREGVGHSHFCDAVF